MSRDLSLSGISHAFGDRQVLTDVDVDVPPGRIVGLLGPNGAGKTTLMRILFGVIEPDAGTISWRGRPTTDTDRQAWGYMPQERGLYLDMRVLDQLVWIARLHGIGRTTARHRATELLERLDLADRADDAVKSLSGGMAQRVQLAAAMVHQPDVLVLDEPFSGLDPGAVDFLVDVVTDHVGQGRHLVFSSHQLDLVEHVCEWITLIDRGRVVLDGSLRDLKAASAERYLRVDVEVDPAWLPGSTRVADTTPAGDTRLLLASDADPGAVLDAIRAHRPVHDFGVDAPSLTELFRAATGRRHDDATEARTQAVPS